MLASLESPVRLGQGQVDASAILNIASHSFVI
jgi:hypothetical protein